jgi:hypothetical protein
MTRQQRSAKALKGLAYGAMRLLTLAEPQLSKPTGGLLLVQSKASTMLALESVLDVDCVRCLGLKPGLFGK